MFIGILVYDEITKMFLYIKMLNEVRFCFIWLQFELETVGERL